MNQPTIIIYNKSIKHENSTNYLIFMKKQNKTEKIFVQKETEKQLQQFFFLFPYYFYRATTKLRIRKTFIE